MKKTLFLLLVALFSMTSLFCEKKVLNGASQVVSGYIGRNVELTIGDYIYRSSNGNKGINLDINNESNNVRYQIAPTQVPCTKAGLLVGKFNLISSTSDITLEISHDKLHNNGGDSVDYELAVDYVIKSDNSTSDHLKFITSTTPYTFDFSSGNGLIIIEDAGIYFRLSEEVTEKGRYESAVTFKLRSK
ncbi:MAG: hypothetical protein K5634_06575 [Sphaerochaetaceae bacterium]|nr:hypothetical protein [Sphaerochaetaceae bacterium]